MSDTNAGGNSGAIGNPDDPTDNMCDTINKGGSDISNKGDLPQLSELVKYVPQLR